LLVDLTKLSCIYNLVKKPFKNILSLAWNLILKFENKNHSSSLVGKVRKIISGHFNIILKA